MSDASLFLAALTARLCPQPVRVMIAHIIYSES
jgi:hypothetical protein